MRQSGGFETSTNSLRPYNPTAAAEVMNGIYESAQQFTEFPELGYRYHGSRDQVRILLYGHYRIAYLNPTAISTF